MKKSKNIFNKKIKITKILFIIFTLFIIFFIFLIFKNSNVRSIKEKNEEVLKTKLTKITYCFNDLEELIIDFNNNLNQNWITYDEFLQEKQKIKSFLESENYNRKKYECEFNMNNYLINDLNSIKGWNNKTTELSNEIRNLAQQYLSLRKKNVEYSEALLKFILDLSLSNTESFVNKPREIKDSLYKNNLLMLQTLDAIIKKDKPLYENK